MNTRSLWKGYTTLTVLGLAAAFLSPVCHAQGGFAAVRINIPFAFDINSQHLQPGLYTFRGGDHDSLQIQGPSRNSSMRARPLRDLDAAVATKLVFRRYGDHYFLSGIWTAGLPNHLQWPLSATERREEVASNRLSQAGTTLTLAANGW